MSKPYRTRRRQPNAARRDVSLHVRVTREQARQIRARAQEARVTVPRLLVESALIGAPHQIQALYTVLEGVQRQLSGVASNVNQIALGVNLGDARQGELLTLTHQDIPALQELINQTKAALEGR